MQESPALEFLKHNVHNTFVIYSTAEFVINYAVLLHLLRIFYNKM